MSTAASLLEGRVVRLEPLEERHFDGLVAVGLDPELWRWTPQLVRDRADMEAYLREALTGRERGDMLPFAILALDSGRVAGCTRYGNIDRANRRLEIGWTWLGRDWWQTAVNTETKLLLLRQAFEGMGCQRVEFKTDRLNQRSRDAIQRLGAKEEGILRKHIVCHDGRNRDTVYSSITDDEWPAVERRLLERLRRG